jgi:hypothetical protein
MPWKESAQFIGAPFEAVTGMGGASFKSKPAASSPEVLSDGVYFILATVPLAGFTVVVEVASNDLATIDPCGFRVVLAARFG